jgi:acyl carrier protein
VADLKAIVAAIVAKNCGLSHASVQNERPLVEYGLDSVRAIELLISLEERFGISIPDEAAQRLRTVNDIARYMQEQTKSSPIPSAAE